VAVALWLAAYSTPSQLDAWFGSSPASCDAQCPRCSPQAPQTLALLLLLLVTVVPAVSCYLLLLPLELLTQQRVGVTSRGCGAVQDIALAAAAAAAEAV
jgi:hypothetical protein